MRVIDLTQTISADMPVYPGTECPTLEPANSYEKDGFKETKLHFYSHTGTHIDPPYHLFSNRTALDEFDASQFVGTALVIDCRDIPDGGKITMEHLKKSTETTGHVDFLLFNLGWDKRWGTDAYFGDYPCIDDEVLDYIIKSDFKGIGFDVIGLDPISDVKLLRHNKLLSSKDIINIENLKNLDLCPRAPFLFACLPIKVKKSDGAPARAVAILND